jgi:hypothetical protein
MHAYRVTSQLIFGRPFQVVALCFGRSLCVRRDCIQYIFQLDSQIGISLDTASGNLLRAVNCGILLLVIALTPVMMTIHIEYSIYYKDYIYYMSLWGAEPPRPMLLTITFVDLTYSYCLNTCVSSELPLCDIRKC